MDLRPDMLARALLGNVPENDAVSFAKQITRDQDRKAVVSALGQTWPVQMARSVVGAAALPGDVYAGRVDPTSQQGIERAADLAGVVTLGSFAAPRPAGSLGMGGRPEKPVGIKAYHGSPHDFDRFDMSKIGTGEGAQAYGHGLYFAEAEGVARNYRDALKGDGAIYRGVRTDDFSRLGLDPAPRAAVSAVGNRMGLENAPAEKAIADAIADIEKRLATVDGVAYQNNKMVLDELKRLDPKDFAPAGRMYEVNIRANPDDFLDWDRPLSQQPEAVKNIPQIKALIDEDAAYLARYPHQSERLGANVLTSIGRSENTKITEDVLRQAGIPGIKYLDQGSRAAGEGSRNYVVFDDSLIDIIRKYGLLGMMGTGAAAGAYATQAPTQGNGT